MPVAHTCLARRYVVTHRTRQIAWALIVGFSIAGASPRAAQHGPPSTHHQKHEAKLDQRLRESLQTGRGADRTRVIITTRGSARERLQDALRQPHSALLAATTF